MTMVSGEGTTYRCTGFDHDRLTRSTSPSRASIESTGSNESMGSMKEFLVAVAKHVATPAKVVGKGIASHMVKAGATALAMGGAPLNYPSTSSGIASSPPKK